jgi:flagellar assembly protein FliH
MPVDHDHHNEELTKETVDVIYNETKVMLEELVARAQQKADDILLKAKEEAHSLIEKSLQDYQVVKDKAYKEGYDQGYEKGLEEAEAEIKKLGRETASLIASLKRQKEDLYRKQEKDVVELVIALTEKILGTVIETRPEVICQVIKNTLEHVRDAEKITVKVNPIHIPYLSGFEEQFKDVCPEKFKIAEDPNIKPGDCQVVTENGYLDSMLEEQLIQLKKALLEVVDDNGI